MGIGCHKLNMKEHAAHKCRMKAFASMVGEGKYRVDASSATNGSRTYACTTLYRSLQRTIHGIENFVTVHDLHAFKVFLTCINLVLGRNVDQSALNETKKMMNKSLSLYLGELSTCTVRE